MIRAPRPWAGLLLGCLALLLLAVGRPAAAAPSFPTLTGRVVDQAHVLPAATVAQLDTKLAALEMKTSRQLVVVTIPSLQGYEIEEYGYQLGRAWGIGQAKLNNGALLIVAPNERRVRIEVGYGLEGVLTDALSSVILQTQVLPRFRAGDMPRGIVAGADALIEQLSLDPSTAEQRAAAAAAQAASRSDGAAPSPLAIIIIVIFVIMMLRSLSGGRRRGLGGAAWIAPVIFGGGRGRWGGGGGFGGGGFGGGGGGFGGGGGSFGGGGSSGSW